MHKRSVSLATTIILTAFVLQACHMFGVPRPQNPREALVVVEMEYQAILGTAVEMRKSGKIDDSMYRVLDKAFSVVSSALDTAHEALEEGDDQTAVLSLKTALSLLDRIRVMLGR